MKLNISFPATGAQKTIVLEDELKARIFYDKRIAQDIKVDSLGDEWKGYILRITGGNDKQGFPMKQGVLLPHRARLLLSEGHSCFRARKNGERKRKSIRGCIVSHDISALSLIVVKQGEGEIDGLTNVTIPKRYGPKRANKIRKMFGLTKEDDVRKFVIKKVIKREGKPDRVKAPKIQRLVTPALLHRRNRLKTVKIRKLKATAEALENYKALLASRIRPRTAAKAQ